METSRRHSPVLIIGAGLAGCTTALCLADKGIEVTLMTAGESLHDGNSSLAQGGIIYKAGVGLADEKALANDIFIAGHKHNSPTAVHFLVKHGPKAVEKILFDRLNIDFARTTVSKDEGEWDLAREGGHSAPRILHCADHTGKSIMDVLSQAVEASPNIRVLKRHVAIDLLTSQHHSTSMTFRYKLHNQCCGVYVFNENTQQVEIITADMTVLATGGVGQVFLHTTNSQSAVGSGLSMASRALVRTENVEFIQFHPTAFYHRDPQRFLITEAMRGEGARLIDAAGRPFMQKHDSRAELAPRDIVSQAIMDEMLQSGEKCVYLDATQLEHDVAKRFPTIYEHCLARGIDIRHEPIPVVPAAHYSCGGILTDLAGRTSLERLYSVGECACTGVHGANRLASTSLLEAVLWGYTSAEHIARNIGRKKLDKRLRDAIADWNIPGNEHNDDPALIAQDWASIRNTMWNYVGITRTKSRLSRAFGELRDLSKSLHDFYKNTPVSRPLIDLFHGCQAAYLITQAAQRNKQSLGCHRRDD